MSEQEVILVQILLLHCHLTSVQENQDFVLNLRKNSLRIGTQAKPVQKSNNNEILHSFSLNQILMI